jgi:hypothetical protein
VTAAIPSVRSLRRRLRRTRRTHSDRTLGDLLGDVYMFALIGVLYGGSAAVSIRRHLAEPLEAPADPVPRAWLVLALLMVVTVLSWRALHLLGPLITTPAAQAWCVATPVGRAAWLRTPMGWLLTVTGAVGAGFAVLAAWAGLAGAAAFAWAAVAGAGLGAALAATAVLMQSRRSPVTGAGAWGPVLGVGVGLAAIAAVFPSAITVSPPRLPAALVAVVAVAFAGWSIRAAYPALSGIDRSTLAGGAQIAGAVMSAAVMLDPLYLTEVIAGRRWRRLGRIHSRHWRPGRRAWVLLQADVRRQWRRRSDLFTWAALLVAPYATAAFAPAAVGSVRIVAAYLAAGRLAGGLRVVCRSAALRRSLGGANWTLRSIHLVVPATGVLVWWLCTLPAGGGPAPAVAVVLVLGLVAAIYRTAARKPMTYDGGLADTPLGPIPVTLLRQVVSGPDLVAVLVVVGLFAGAATTSGPPGA